MPKTKLTKREVDNIPMSDSGQVNYWDTELKGFGLTVGAKTKTYFVWRRVNGKLRKTVIGRHNEIPIQKAREQAAELLVEMRKGINPNDKKKVPFERTITLRKAYEEFVKIRTPKQTTVINDKSLLKTHLSDWLDKPIADITKDMVSKRHRELRDKKSNHTANNVFRLLSRIYNCVNANLDGVLPENPVTRLSSTKQWAKVDRRRTIIADCDLPTWYASVHQIDNVFMRNCLLLLLFTGIRKNEGLSLSWSNVNLADKTFTIPETKNGKPHTLPMSNYLFDIFTELQKFKLNDYVFPALAKSKKGHMTEPKRHVQHIVDSSGVKFCLHDLRRVFKTLAQDTVTKAESDKLTNHSSRDAGDGYIILTTEKVREPMQRITDKLLCLAHVWSDLKGSK